MAVQSPAFWYCDSVSYAAISAWTALNPYTAGQVVRQVSPAVGSERAFICIIAGTSLAAEPTWTTTKGATTAEAAGPTWQEFTGRSASNGSTTNTPLWPQNTSIPKGYIVKNTAVTHYFICSTAGTSNNSGEPTWNTTTGGTTADNGATWTCIGAVGSFTAFLYPFARLTTAVASGFPAAGDTTYVGDNHSETQSTTMTVTSVGSNTAPSIILCVDHTVATPGSGDLKTAAIVATTGASFINMNGAFYLYGITFNAGDGANAAAPAFLSSGGPQRFENCTFAQVGTGATNITIGSGGTNASAHCEFKNCTITFSATSQYINPRWGDFVMTGGSIGGSALPTTLFPGVVAPGPVTVILSGVDLSAFGAGKTIVGANGAVSRLTLFECKLGASVTVCATQTSLNGAVVNIINCDSSGTGYHQESHVPSGDVVVETTDVRSGGASDGVTPISWKITSNSLSSWAWPCYTFPIVIWNTTTGSSVTATIELMNDGVTFTNADVWAEVEYLGSAGSPISSIATSGTANIYTSGTSLTASSATWTTTGISSPVKQKIAISFTPQIVGYVRMTVRVARASTTLYVDPLITLS